MSRLHAKIREERYQLLLKNHVERLRLIIAGIENWAGMSVKESSQEIRMLWMKPYAK